MWGGAWGWGSAADQQGGEADQGVGGGGRGGADGVGLLLQLPSPTALSEVTIDVPSTGTVVQVRAAENANPSSLSDTTELTPNVTLRPGENTITVDNQKKTSNVLVWISKLGTVGGQSRTAISDITLRAARR